MKTNNEIKINKDEFFNIVIDSEKLTSIPECVDVSINNIVDLMMSVSAVYMNIIELQIDDILDIMDTSKLRVVTRESTSPMIYDEFMLVNNIRFEVAMNKVKALKGDYTELNINPKNYKNKLKIFLEKRALIECLFKDLLYILLGFKSTVKSENIIRLLKLPELLRVYNINISRYDNIVEDTLHAVKHLTSNSQEVFSLIKDFREQCENKLEPIVTMLRHEVQSIINPINDLIKQNAIKANKLCNNIKNEKNIELKENEETDIQENQKSQEYRYIDNYKELESLAKSNNYEYIRCNNNHSIFKNSKGDIIVIPQDRFISEKLSIEIQKIIMGK